MKVMRKALHSKLRLLMLPECRYPLHEAVIDVCPEHPDKNPMLEPCFRQKSFSVPVSYLSGLQGRFDIAVDC